MAMQGFDQNLPPEIDAESQRIARQQAIAEAMLNRSMAPLPTNQGPLHWTQALAQVVNARQGRADMDAASRDRAGLGQKYQQGLSDEVKRIAAMRRASPEIIQDTSAEGTGSFDMSGTPGPANVQSVPGNPKAAIEAALLSQYGPVRQMGALEHKTYENEQTKQGDREARLHERILALDAAAQNASLAREERATRATEAATLRRELAEMQDATRRAIAGSRSTVNVNPAVTVTEIVKDGKVVKIDARTGNVLGESPKESDAQKRENKRAFNMQGIGATIQQAEDLLNGVKRNPDGTTSKGQLPTDSGAGALLDAGAGFFGVSPRGAVQAKQLEAVGGALTSKMPRMEGPQSDKDLAQYKLMAAEVGNRSIPIEQRKAALEKVKELWARYEKLNPDAFAAPAAGGDGWSVVR